MIKSRKKITFVLLGAYPYFSNDPKIIASGGAELDTYSIAKCLNQATFDPHFIVGDFGQPDSQIVNGITLHKLHSYPGFFGNIWNPFQLWLLINKIRPNIIFSKGISWQTAELMIINYLINARLVIKSSHRRNIDGSLHRFFYGKFCKIFTNMIDIFILQNQEDEHIFRKTFPYFHNRLLTIRNFHELPPRKERTFYSKQCTWIGRAESFKRPDLYLELASSLPEWQFHLVMPPSSSSLFEEIKKKSSRISNVVFTPGLSRQEIYNLLSETTYLVSTSTNEGFPNTFIDALKVGTPIISFLDFDNLIQTYQSGKIVKTVPEMANTIKEISPEKWFQLSDNARKMAEQEFSLQFGSKMYHTLFESLT